jgi:hypothetical protein
MAVFYKIVKLVKLGVLMIIHILPVLHGTFSLRIVLLHHNLLLFNGLEQYLNFFHSLHFLINEFSVTKLVRLNPQQ